MQINLIDVYAINAEIGELLFQAINLYPYPLLAIDVFVMCESTEKYNWLMTKSLLTNPTTQIISEVSKISIDINGTIYPIQTGSPGESPTNPITYSITGQNKINNTNFLGGAPDGSYTELPQEASSNVGTRAIGTNFITEGTIPMRLRVNDKSIITTKTFPFGGSDGVENYDGFGGSEIDGPTTYQITGFGGVPPNDNLKGITLVIQKSQFVDRVKDINEGLEVGNYGVRY